MNNRLYIRIVLSAVIAFSLSGSTTGRTVKDERKDAGYYNSLGLRHLQKREYEKAVKFFLLAIDKNPGVIYYHNSLAAVYMKLEDYDRAYEVLGRCIDIDAGYTKALANMAVTAFRLNRYLESYIYYNRALKADPVYTRKRFEKNRVVRYLRLLPHPEGENRGFSEALKYIEKSE